VGEPMKPKRNKRAEQLDKLVKQEAKPIKKVRISWKRFSKYLIRWQLSTPILAGCVWLLPFGTVSKTIVANLIGGCTFYLVDRWIFKGER